MKCDCGYEGLAELGNFPDERFRGKWKKLSYMNIPYMCPKCKSNKDIEYIDSIDEIRRVLIFGEFCSRGHTKTKKIVNIITGGADNTTVGYSIFCPVCNWGEGSCIPVEDYINLIKEAKEGKFVLIGKDCNTELKKFGLG